MNKDIETVFVCEGCKLEYSGADIQIRPTRDFTLSDDLKTFKMSAVRFQAMCARCLKEYLT